MSLTPLAGHNTARLDVLRAIASDALPQVVQYRAEGLSLKEAARKVAEETGLSKNRLYDLALSQ